MSYCPECDAVIEEDIEEVGEIITCPECGVELEVISLDPLEFDLAPVDDDEDDFDFDDDDDEDDDWDDDEPYDDDDEDDEDDDF
ncbi:MAG: hypothetical protein JXP48_13405 [Acidobacteria bacterium]|nr:hypothetical protein [Acidobacteriota bacterium]